MNEDSIYIDLLRISKENFLIQHDEFEAYHKWLNSVQQLEKKYATKLSQEVLDGIFQKPTKTPKKERPDKTILGDDIGTEGEFSDLKDIKYATDDAFHKTWLEELKARNELTTNNFYKEFVRKKGLSGIKLKPQDDIENHALHILARCNNPKAWEETEDLTQYEIPNRQEVGDFNWKNLKGDTYWNNKQGLVYGMVQSGKTASMISLIGLAHTAGYKLFIILAGDKNSLRSQTQERINNAFELNYQGICEESEGNIQSITTIDYDYNDVTKSQRNGIEVFSHPIGKKRSIILCIKKSEPVLRKLIKDLKDLQKDDFLNNFNYNEDLKALIIDDEADYASQNTKKGSQASSIHQLIVDLRMQLSQNTYVGYTATPQACLGADPNALVGYPNDFIWLISPYTVSGETLSYMGLHEFFDEYVTNLIVKVPPEAWPQWEPDPANPKKKVKKYTDAWGEEKELDESLVEHEKKILDDFIQDSKLRKHSCHIYVEAIVDFLITCSIRWYRHYMENKHFFKDLPTKKQIELINTSQGVTKDGFKEFPNHAMMFNLAYIQETQNNLINLLEILFKEVEKDFTQTVKFNWLNSESIYFVERYNSQLAKTTRLNKKIPNNTDLQHFIDIAIKIAKCPIFGLTRYIYELNSSDSGSSLNYSKKRYQDRPKKASIIVGGNILSRGLTVNNLSTSVFLRSQAMSLGDTNLQMCRWFGHKRNDIDLLSIYLKEHSLDLFQSINEADKELRAQFKEYIYKGTPNECILLYLKNNPLFRVTSPAKSRLYSKTDEGGYSGLTVDCKQPVKHIDWKANTKILDDYRANLDQSRCAKKIKNLERADVYYDVDPDNFFNFFLKLNIAEDAHFVTPKKYHKYYSEWCKNGQNPPKVNIAFFGRSEEKEWRSRAYRYAKTDQNGIAVSKLQKNASNEFEGGLTSIRGEKSQGTYIGDVFVDQTKSWHTKNYEKAKGWKRLSDDGILVMFWYLDPNYWTEQVPDKKSKTGDTKLRKRWIKPGEPDYIDQAYITFSIATCLGGPMWNSFYNKGRLDIRQINTKKCEKFEIEYQNRHQDEINE